MPKHSDATGYLRDLGISEGLAWFKMVCDLAINGQISLTQDDLEVPVALFTNKASYIQQVSPAATTVMTVASTGTDTLESLSAFTDFKRLSTTLEALFPKHITLIFGANGSGKSSLCEALKLLASIDAPSRPLHNVCADGAKAASFNYKFTSDPSSKKWSIASGYGVRADAVMYFDTAIHVRNVKSPVEPGKVIELSPFKLYIFEIAKERSEERRVGKECRSRWSP